MTEIRDVLFGDVPLSQWPADDQASGEPWRTFIEARRATERGDTSRAIDAFRRIADMLDLEPRQHLQAWHFLRMAGVAPPAELAKRLEGVVVEVGLEEGLDLVAAYRDRSARYVNFSGRTIIWEHPNPSLDGEIDALLTAGRRVVAVIGPWDRPRPAAPGAGEVRLNFLTPSGLHFGQGRYQDLAADKLGGPVISAALQLMRALIARTQP
jgi:hypothetical protein